MLVRLFVILLMLKMLSQNTLGKQWAAVDGAVCWQSGELEFSTTDLLVDLGQVTSPLLLLALKDYKSTSVCFTA